MTVTGAQSDLAGDQLSRVRLAVPPEPPTIRVGLAEAPTVRLSAPSPARSGSAHDGVAPEPATVLLRPRPLRYVPVRHGPLRPRVDRTRTLLMVVAALGILLAGSLVLTVLTWR